MNRRYLLAAGRLLAALFALFLALFALDVFEAGTPPLAALGAFLIHLLPTYLVVAALAVAWRWPRLGGLLFFALAALYVAAFRDMVWGAYLLVAGPPVLIGALFIAGGWPRRAA